MSSVKYITCPQKFRKESIHVVVIHFRDVMNGVFEAGQFINVSEIRTLAVHLARSGGVLRNCYRHFSRYAAYQSSDIPSKYPDFFRTPVCESPTVEQISNIAEEMRIPIAKEDVQQMKVTFDQFLKCYETFQEIPELKPTVKYPRTPGYVPEPHENKHNAWYVKTDIRGAATGKLAGKTIGIKDNLSLAGVPMASGTRLLEGYIPEIDATVVTRILDEGGHIIGKTTCSDLSDDSASFSANNGPVPNFYDPTRSAGGSSSGSGIVVAAGEVDMALGTDTAGSIRIPACNSGIVGLKPTFGLVPTTGMVPLERTLDHVGPMTKTAYDAALLLEVIAGYDGGLCHKQYPGIQSKDYTKLLDKDLSGMRVGLLREGFEKTEEDVERMVKEAAHSLRGAGASVDEVSIPLHSKAWDVNIIICAEGASQNLYRSHCSGSNWKGFYQTTLQDFYANAMKARPHDMGLWIKFHLIFGVYQEKYYHNRFLSIAQNVRRRITQEYEKALETYDVLILPTIPFKPQELPLNTDTLDEKLTKGVEKLYDDGHYGYISWNTLPFAASGHPAVSVNAGFSEGLPVGMMVVGRHFEDDVVLRFAHNFELIRDGK